jgi:hypothetical protein
LFDGLARDARPTEEEYAVTAQAPNAFIAWTATYGQYYALYFQVLYWVALGIAALWAAKNFSTYVKYMTTDEVDETSADESAFADESGSDAADVEADEEKKPVDEFVE